MKVFISYTRDKDEFNSVSEFRQHFSNELRQLVPGSTVFQDTDQIGAGDYFPEKLTQELNNTDLLLVLVSPAWLTRPWCRREFEIFSARERERNRAARILPVLWVRTDELNSPGTDPIAQQLAQIQYADWRNLRHEDWRNPDVRRQIAKLAERAKILGTTAGGKAETTAGSPQTIFTQRRSNAISELFNEVLSDWEIWQKPGVHDLFGTAGRKYVQRTDQLYNNMRVLGMDAPVPLRTIYVRVNILEKVTARHEATVKDLEEFFQRDKRGFGPTQTTKTALEVVNGLRKIIVLGKPGAGKTTLLKWLALVAVDGLLSATHVPIFVSLKEWSESSRPLLQFIASEFDSCGFPDPLPYVRRLLQNGKCLLLLDGFDEVTGDVSKAINEIKEFSNTYFQNQFILSCRIAAYDYVFEQFTEVEMADFEDNQIKTFIDNWFGESSLKSNRCWSQLQKDAAIRELASIPLLLTMLCLAFDEQMTFPTNRAELYREAVNALLKKWDSSRNISRQEVYKQLTPRRKESLLGFVAFQTFHQGQYFLPRKLLESYVRDYIQHLPGAAESTLELDSEAIVKSIEAHHGLLVERAKSIYSFSHLTFQEYFTACYILDHWSEEQLREMLMKHLLEHDWREVILLAAGMLTPSDQLLRGIRSEISSSITHEVLSLLKEATECVIPSPPCPMRVSIIWAIAFIIDRIRGVKIAGERRPSTVPEHSRDLSPFGIRQIEVGVEPSYYLDRIFERVTYVARVMDPEFNPRADFEKRTDIRRTLNFSRALDYVRAHDRSPSNYGRLFETLNTYLYGTELLYQCLNGECYVSKTVRAELLDSLMVEPF